MKTILMSVQPKWLEKILNGEATVLINKRMPKCDLPIDVYLYCGKGKLLYKSTEDKAIRLVKHWTQKQGECNSPTLERHGHKVFNNKVVAKFTMRECKEFTVGYATKKSMYYGLGGNPCLTFGEIKRYVDTGRERDGTDGKIGYAWHITDLVVFDEPMELGKFYKHCKWCENAEQRGCACLESRCEYYSLAKYDECGGYWQPPECNFDPKAKLTRPPQSWQYVEMQNE